jgi:TonB family protein
MIYAITLASMLVTLNAPNTIGATSTVLRAVAPAYPEAARQAHLNGDIEVMVRIDATGKVTDVKAKRAFPPFERPCIKAASAWRFSPRPVSAETEEKVLTFRFRIIDWDVPDEEGGVIFEAPTVIEIRSRMTKPKPIE